MRKVLALMLTILLSSISCLGQVTFKGSDPNVPVTTDEDASPVIVDPALQISSPHEIDGARVVITSNFTDGDKLSFSETLLPLNVTGTYEPSKGILTFEGNASAAEYQELLRTVSFTAFASGAKNRVIEFYLGAKFLFKANNHYYEYVNSSEVKWTVAKDNAEAQTYFGLKGYLATITSSAENQFLQQSFGKDGWIGATDDNKEVNKANPTIPLTDQGNFEANFYWVSGPEKGIQFSEKGGNDARPVNNLYTNWMSGEPNGWISGNYVKFKMNGGWDDMVVAGESWDRVNGYFVEYGGLAGEPTIEVTHSRTIEIKPTTLSTTLSKNYFNQNTNVVIDPDLVLKSGGMIKDVSVVISGNLTTGDLLFYDINKVPTGVTPQVYNTTTGVLSFKGMARPSKWQELLRSVTFQTSSTSSSDRTVSFRIANLISSENGHFYEYVPANTSNWAEARDAASARTYLGLRGYLATITSNTENDLIAKLISGDAWLGGADDVTEVIAAGISNGNTAVEGNFYWLTGPEKGQLISSGNYDQSAQTPKIPTGGYAHWYKSEPNNLHGAEHYFEMYGPSSGALGDWNDFPFNSARGMVVEYGGIPADPGIELSTSRILAYDLTLPVRGLTLQLKQKGGSVVLNWSVLGEEKVSHYDVLHSVNGNSFRKIAEVKAKDDNGQIVYSYTDQHAVNGTNYYKIVVVDEDGKLHYSDVRSIGIASKLQLYPTVITDHFTVNQPNATPCLLTLTDVSGVRLLQKTIGQGINNIETGFLTGGTYFVQITRGSNEPEVFKIIKK